VTAAEGDMFVVSMPIAHNFSNPHTLQVSASKEIHVTIAKKPRQNVPVGKWMFVAQYTIHPNLGKL
jgi:hypothetical protein